MTASSTATLRYPRTSAAPRPARVGIRIAFLVTMWLLEFFGGSAFGAWPSATDYAVMVLLPVGAVIWSLVTTVATPLIGMYGSAGALILLTGQCSDRNL